MYFILKNKINHLFQLARKKNIKMNFAGIADSFNYTIFKEQNSFFTDKRKF